MTALAVVGTVLIVAAPVVGSWFDRLATERAATDVAMFYHYARLSAQLRAQIVRLELSADRLTATYEGLSDSTFLDVAGPAGHGVTAQISRAVIRIAPSGLGWGAANTKIVLRRGAAAESLTTSRLGRLKRWR